MINYDLKTLEINELSLPDSSGISARVSEKTICIQKEKQVDFYRKKSD